MSVYEGGISKITISADGQVGRGYSSRAQEDSGPSNEVEIQIDVDLVSLDFTEDMFSNSMLGTIFLSNRTGWDHELGNINGTEWIEITFDSQAFTGEGTNKTSIPATNKQRFKVYKVSNSTSEAGTLSTYAFGICSFQFLVDSVKLERHLSDQHIGPIGTAKTNLSEFTNQDYGFVNKIFDHMQAAADVSITGTIEENGELVAIPVIDVEETDNWINYVPAYLNNQNTNSLLSQSRNSRGFDSPTANLKENRPKKVFETLNELAENAVSKDNPNAANFFVWQDLHGWHFRSVDSYLRGREDYADVDKTYSFDITSQDTNPSTEIDRIIDLQVMKQVDFMDLLNVQALSSKIIYYELNPDNDYASYYMTLPENLLGTTRVIGPNGFQDGIGETLIQKQALIESGISYDYLKDRTKWSSVEAYPLLQDIENQYTDYSFPSFLETPPAYNGRGIGNDSWFTMGSDDEQSTGWGWNAYTDSGNIGLGQSFRMNNRVEFFKQQFLSQTTLKGSNFRIVHDKIKKPIINALRDYYNTTLQRLFYEHNLVIQGGINTLEAGEGKIGRGDGGLYCDYCLNREQTLSEGESYLKRKLGNEFFQSAYVDRYTYDEGFDRVNYENSVIQGYLWGLNRLEGDQWLPGHGLNDTPGSAAPEWLDFLDYNVNDFDGNAFQTCRAKIKDQRTQILGYPIYAVSYSGGGFGGGGQREDDQARANRFYLNLPVEEYDNVAAVDASIQGASYPRCTTPEPLLPYDGTKVDCVSVREKWEAIPSECQLVSTHLGPEYVSPILRGNYGQPVNVTSLTLWNGYWINPRFGLPNRNSYIQFFRDLDANYSGTPSLNAVHESAMFLKDFLAGGNSIASQALETNYVLNDDDRDYDDVRFYGGDVARRPGKFYGGAIPEFYIDASTSMSRSGNIRNSTFIDPDPVQQGDSITHTFTPSVNYVKNIAYNKALKCSTPFLCGHQSVSGETISVPYVKKIIWRAVEVGGDGGDGGGFGGSAEPRYALELSSVQTSTKSVKFPAIWSRGLPYNYGNISNLPKRFTGYNGNFLDSSYLEFLKQFGIIDDDYLQNQTGGQFIIEEQNSATTGFGNNAGIAEVSGTFRRKGIETTYFPNNAGFLGDANRPIYHKKDWQNFLDCRGTCVGSVPDGGENVINPEKNKAVEYAKYCSYAWNRYWSTPKEQPMYRRAQVALLQSQEIEITIPNDMNLTIGNLVRLNLPKSYSLGDTSQITNQIEADPIAGKYIVTGIRRMFSASNTQAMKVRLNRDSLPFDPNK